ncbi:MAG: reverse transcriptase/maturase family protein, partial [Nanoarchaeota archaeon]|nr:reverse transcriptase/maturase family protein [Nanoarchaeota archaeon]
TFILRDPKTRKISKAVFRDRIVHHALVQIIEPFFDKCFIFDSCANRIKKGNLFALKRFDLFKRKVTNNLNSEGYCLKADIRHYFQEVNHDILIKIIKRKISDEKVMGLVRKILKINSNGMPLGNLTSQFFANVYLHELDFFVKHKLKVKYYIRYVDDFIILHKSKEKLDFYKKEINNFLMEEIKLELHSQKSKVVSISRGVDFVGFRIFWKHKLTRKRNSRKMFLKIKKYKTGEIPKETILESFQGWNAYTK